VGTREPKGGSAAEEGAWSAEAKEANGQEENGGSGSEEAITELPRPQKRSNALPGVALFEALMDVACGAPKRWTDVRHDGANAAAAAAAAEAAADVALAAAEALAAAAVEIGSDDPAVQLAAQSAAAEAHEEVKAARRARAAAHEAQAVKDAGHDVAARRYACLSLGALAAVPARHAALLHAGLLQALLDGLDADDPETRFAAAFCANKLACANDENQWVLMAAAGLVAALVATVADPADEDASTQALSALRRLLATVPENRHLALDAGLLGDRVLGAALASTHAEARREAAALMAHFTLSHGCREPTARSPCLLPLLELCRSEDPETARCACGAVANLAEDAEGTHRPLLFKVP
jgi:hypothetical protein